MGLNGALSAAAAVCCCCLLDVMHRFIMQDVVDERVRLGSREEVFHTEKPAEGKPGQVRGGRMGRWQGREGAR